MDSNEQSGTALKSAIKEAGAELDAAAYAKYGDLSEDEVKTLVVYDKWLAMLDPAIHGEIDRIEQALTRRVKELAERYQAPLPELTKRVAELEERVPPTCNAWDSHGTEAGIQADRGRVDPEGLEAPDRGLGV